jgi:REP element-mobilizing transposase RayT
MRHRRLPRLDLPNESYFVSVTTARFRPWFQNPQAAEVLCQVICAERGRSVLLHAFVVMPDHYHLLVTLLGAHRIPRLVQRINSLSARSINAAAGREGRIWARRFYDHVVRNTDDFHECMQYIHDNPRVAGMAESPGGYGYSSTAFWEMRESRWGEFDPP